MSMFDFNAKAAFPPHKSLVPGQSVSVLIALLALLGSVIFSFSTGAQTAELKDRNANWALGLASADPDRAWELFLLLTAPAAGGAGMEWEQWKATPQVFPPGGKVPTPWGDPLARTLDSAPDGGSLTLDDGVHLNSTAGKNFVDGGLRDLKGRPIYSEIRMNEITFNAVVENQLYSVEGQLAFFKAGQDLSLLDGAIEVKVTWRILDAEEDPKLAATYLTAMATRSANGETESVLLGMTSMNILSKHDGAWFATAFEHEANPVQTLDDLYPQVVLALRAPENYGRANEKAQANLAGDPRAHYGSSGGQATFVADDGGPVFLTNTQQETQLVRTSSCLSCHSYSAITIIDDEAIRLSPLVTQNEDGTATGYLGEPDMKVLSRFSTFDMMWSMIEAQPTDPSVKVRMLRVSQLPPGK